LSIRRRETPFSHSPQQHRLPLPPHHVHTYRLNCHRKRKIDKKISASCGSLSIVTLHGSGHWFPPNCNDMEYVKFLQLRKCNRRSSTFVINKKNGNRLWKKVARNVDQQKNLHHISRPSIACCVSYHCHHYITIKLSRTSGKCVSYQINSLCRKNSRWVSRAYDASPHTHM
jgi:hypothetical protein